MIPNSSPPSRATVSPLRSVCEVSRNSISSASPLGWPKVSLTSLNWSRSRSSSAKQEPSRRGTMQGLLRSVAEQRAVRQVGQAVVQRLVLDLVHLLRNRAWLRRSASAVRFRSVMSSMYPCV